MIDSCNATPVLVEVVPLTPR